MASRGKYTKRRSTSYKSDEAYLQAAWRALDEDKHLSQAFRDYMNLNGFESKISARTEFLRLTRQLVEGEIKGATGNVVKIEPLSPVNAVKEVINRAMFKPYKERAKENAIQSLRKFKGYGPQGNQNAYQELKRKVGWREKFDFNKIVYDRKNMRYVYDDRIAISFKNSPERIEFYEKTIMTDKDGNEFFTWRMI